MGSFTKLDDLDALLEDLGRPKSTVQAKKLREPSSRVDLDELEDLMHDLSTPSTKLATPVAKPPPTSAPQAKPQPAQTPLKPAVKPASKVTPIPMQAKAVTVSAAAPKSQPVQHISAMEDLDSLMASLGTAPVRDTRVTAPPVQAAKPAAPFAAKSAVATPPPIATATPAPPPATSGMDDLDELLNSLEPARAPSVSAKAAPAKPAAVVVAPRAPAATTSPAVSSPPPTFTPPVQAAPPYVAPKPSAPPPNARPPPAAKPAARTAPLVGDDLDNLLSNLTDQMKDVDTGGPASRGTCASCKKSILGELIQALGKCYHPEHFVCGNCQNPLGTSNFYEQDGSAHCEKCYQELFCARCAHCDEPILDRCVTAIGKKWHVNHFVCAQCSGPFPGGSFFERDGRPFCETCFYGAFAPKCGSCQQPIRGECVNALGQQWHPEHFVCQYCQKSFAGGSFYEYGGKPYCELHYHQQQGSLCQGCGKAITGKVVNALDKKWHPEHFVCAFCMNPLAGGSFTENAGKAYCRDCYGKLFN